MSTVEVATARRKLRAKKINTYAQRLILWTLATWFLKWEIWLRTNPVALQTGWSHIIFSPVEWWRKWRFSTWFIMCETQLKVHICSLYESRLFSMHLIHCIFWQMTENSIGAEKGSAAGYSLLTKSFKAEANHSWQVWSFCQEVSAIMRLMTDIFQETMAWELRSLKRSQRLCCNLVCSSSWCSITGLASSSFSAFSSSLFKCFCSCLFIISLWIWKK